MSEPIITEPVVEGGKAIVATASGGGLLAILLEFFRGRERARMQAALATLEARTDALHERVDAMQEELDEHWDGASKRINRRRRAIRSTRRKTT